MLSINNKTQIRIKLIVAGLFRPFIKKCVDWVFYKPSSRNVIQALANRGQQCRSRNLQDINGMENSLI